MKFSKIFQSHESLNLDKKTLVFLRWIAIIGQLITIYFVYLILKFDLPIIYCTVTLSLGLLTNFYLQFLFKKSTVNDFESTAILIFDLLLLGILLFLTGGIKNPFIIFLIVPAIVSSTLLNLRNTALICLITILLLAGLTFYHFPIPSPGKIHFHVPGYFLYAISLSLIIALIFLSYFGTRFGIESRKKTQALNKLELIIAKEHELESIGLQAAAAAHSLGTPLATISVVSRELRKEIAKESKYSDDLDLLISQTNRCKEILKKISEKQIIDDRFISNVEKPCQGSCHCTETIRKPFHILSMYTRKAGGLLVSSKCFEMATKHRSRKHEPCKKCQDQECHNRKPDIISYYLERWVGNINECTFSGCKNRCTTFAECPRKTSQAYKCCKCRNKWGKTNNSNKPGYRIPSNICNTENISENALSLRNKCISSDNSNFG